MKEKYDFYLDGKNVIFLVSFWIIIIAAFILLVFSNIVYKKASIEANNEIIEKDKIITNLQIEIAEDNTYIEWLQERIKILDKEELKIE